jgi:hypothetical protein
MAVRMCCCKLQWLYPYPVACALHTAELPVVKYIMAGQQYMLGPAQVCAFTIPYMLRQYVKHRQR